MDERRIETLSPQGKKMATQGREIEKCKEKYTSRLLNRQLSFVSDSIPRNGY